MFIIIYVYLFICLFYDTLTTVADAFLPGPALRPLHQERGGEGRRDVHLRGQERGGQVSRGRLPSGQHRSQHEDSKVGAFAKRGKFFFIEILLQNTLFLFPGFWSEFITFMVAYYIIIQPYSLSSFTYLERENYNEENKIYKTISVLAGCQFKVWIISASASCFEF